MSIETLRPSRPAAAVTGSPAGTFGAIVARDVTAGTDMHIRVPSFDGGRLLRGPYPWTPVGATLPAEGDPALVVYPDDGTTPWVVAWRPA